jgi:hypothetical protein
MLMIKEKILRCPEFSYEGKRMKARERYRY